MVCSTCNSIKEKHIYCKCVCANKMLSIVYLTVNNKKCINVTEHSQNISHVDAKCITLKEWNIKWFV